MVRVLRMTDLDLKGKRVLIREDLNVPVKNGVVTSDARIRASLVTTPFLTGTLRSSRISTRLPLRSRSVMRRTRTMMYSRYFAMTRAISSTLQE